MLSRNRLNDREGFTLIEMLIVMSIISLLVAFLVLGVSNAIDISEQEATKTLIQKLERGLETYESDFKSVPKSKSMKLWIPPPDTSPSYRKYEDSFLHALLGSELMYVASFDPVTKQEQFARAGPYIEKFSPDRVKGGRVNDPEAPLMDAWGDEIRYRFPGKDHSDSSSCGSRDNTEWVDIWSEGGKEESAGPNDGCGEDDLNNFASDPVSRDDN